MTTQIVLAAFLVIMAIVILAGKGDWMIAGYNTASKKEKEQVNIKRLRFIVGLFLLIVAPLLFILGDNLIRVLVFVVVVIALAVCCSILANTWAKKK